jgi:hypothetical protein
MEDLWKNIPEFPQFKDLSLEEKPLLDAVFVQSPPVISEFTFTNLFIWRHAYQIKVSRLQNFILLLGEGGASSFFFPTVGEGDVVKCYRFRENGKEGWKLAQCGYHNRELLCIWKKKKETGQKS